MTSTVTITYIGDFGDVITEYPPFRRDGWRVTVSHNQTGWRLIPPTCRRGCAGLVVWHVERESVGTHRVFCCDDHLPADVASAVR